MQHQKCSLSLCSTFLLANQNRYSGLELSKTVAGIAHDSVSRRLSKFVSSSQELWSRAKDLVRLKRGYLVILATNDLSLSAYKTFTGHFQQCWNIEEFHRGIKQTTGIEKCYSTKSQSQKTHIFAAFVAFVRLEAIRISQSISWYGQKASITRFTVANYINYANA